MIGIAAIRSLLVVAALAVIAPARAGEPEKPEPRARLTCLPPAETREEIKARHLLEPFAVLKSAQTQFKAEPLSAKLCRLGDDFVYEIALLHKDGRFVREILNAVTGKFVETRHAQAAAPKPKE